MNIMMALERIGVTGHPGIGNVGPFEVGSVVFTETKSTATNQALMELAERIEQQDDQIAMLISTVNQLVDVLKKSGITK